MSVYVDDMRRAAGSAEIAGYHGRRARWSHLMADTSEELRAFADQLGLHPDWVQHAGRPTEHYDVTDTVRIRALALGALSIRYGREGGLLTMMKAARGRGDWKRVTDCETRLKQMGSVIVAGVSGSCETPGETR